MNNNFKRILLFVVDVAMALAFAELAIDMLRSEPASAMLVIILPIAFATRIGCTLIKVR